MVSSSHPKLVLAAHSKGVTTLRMNMPARLNGWTLEMMEALRGALLRAADDKDTKVVILTGTDPYYSAGVNLGGTIKLQHPRKLHALIVEHNQALFDSFLDFPKPLLVAVNGPAIGASVTSATLCDGIIASERATFSTPLPRSACRGKGVPACSSNACWAQRPPSASSARKAGSRPGLRPTTAASRNGWFRTSACWKKPNASQKGG